jgi:RNA polymerase sigma-70 factor (family 1)
MVTNDKTGGDELVSLLVAGNDRAFAQIYRRHVSELLRYADARLPRRQDSEDMVQAVFVDLWSRRARLDPESRIPALLFHNLKCRLIEHYRHTLVRERYVKHVLLTGEVAANSTETENNYRETKALIDSGVDALPPAMQTAFRLSREHHLSAAEIADRMQISARTVEAHLLTARHRIKALLKSTSLLLTCVFWF